MNRSIRELKHSEVGLLDIFLYHVIYIPQGLEAPAWEIINQPELRIYTQDFGKKDDTCCVAEVNNQVVGAAWARIMNDYGHVDDETPSLSISVLPEYRNQGIGTELVESLLSLLRERGYSQVSLSVQKENYAVRMYRKLGFVVLRENDEDYVMVRSL